MSVVLIGMRGVFILFVNLEDEELGQHEAMDKIALEKRKP